MSEKCPSRFVIYDDRGKNEVTFDCGLHQGHVLPHEETGAVRDGEYRITWRESYVPESLLAIFEPPVVVWLRQGGND